MLEEADCLDEEIEGNVALTRADEPLLIVFLGVIGGVS